LHLKGILKKLKKIFLSFKWFRGIEKPLKNTIDLRAPLKG